MSPLSPNLVGAACMTLGMASGAVSDTVIKLLSGEMNMGQLMLLRGVVATLFIYLVARQRHALLPVRTALQPMVLLRSISEIGATVTFLIALSRVPVANASAIMQATPLAVTMGAALVLHEPVGWRRWTAILVGFVGVMIIIRPGAAGFTTDSLLLLVTVAFVVVRDLATRRIPPGVPSLFISTITAPAVALTGAILMVPMGGWTPVGAAELGWLAAAAVLLLANQQLITMAVRTGEIAFIVPFRYTHLPVAMVMGYLVFAHVPDIFMLIGGAIVVGSGLYAFHRERRLARRLASLSPPVPR